MGCDLINRVQKIFKLESDLSWMAPGHIALCWWKSWFFSRLLLAQMIRQKSTITAIEFLKNEMVQQLRWNGIWAEIWKNRVLSSILVWNNVFWSKHPKIRILRFFIALSSTENVRSSWKLKQSCFPVCCFQPLICPLLSFRNFFPVIFSGSILIFVVFSATEEPIAFRDSIWDHKFRQ